MFIYHSMYLHHSDFICQVPFRLIHTRQTLLLSSNTVHSFSAKKKVFYLVTCTCPPKCVQQNKLLGIFFSVPINYHLFYPSLFERFPKLKQKLFFVLFHHPTIFLSFLSSKANKNRLINFYRNFISTFSISIFSSTNGEVDCYTLHFKNVNLGCII